MRSSHDSIFSGFSRTALSAAIAIVVAAPALAQNTTAAMGGRVSGVDGKPIAGATVSIVHRESGSTSTLVTDAEGRYAARGLRVGGPYVITVVKGSDKDVRDEVYLQLAENQTVDLTLGGATLNAVVVTGAAARVFDSANKGASTQIGRQDLDAFASVQRNLQDYARMDPRLAQTDKERGEISALGQNSRFNTVTIDGVSITDTFGLESNNLPTAKQPISIDAIQSVQVNIANFDVTQKGYTGANINAVTKSGTNAVKGSVYYVMRDEKLSGERYSRTNNTYSATPEFKESTKGFTLGGPIIKDKLFFFMSAEDFRSSRNSPTFGPMGSSQTNVGITQTQIDAAVAAAQSKYGIDVGSLNIPAGTELTAKDYTFKFDWNINDQHRANVRFSRIEQVEPVFYGFGNSGLSLSSHWTAEKKVLESAVGQWFADWTPEFSTEFKISSRNNPKTFENNSTLPQVSLVFNGPAPSGAASTGNRTLNFGTELNRHFNVLQTKTIDTYFAGTLVKGDHELKFGVDYSKNDIYNAFLSSTNGVYSFQGADPVALFLAGKPTSYSVQVAQPGATLNDGIANWTLSNLGIFAQDTFAINDKLNLTAGVRIDRSITGDRPTSNPKVTTAFGYDNTVTIDGQNLVQPRLGFNYQLDSSKESRSQIRGGVGLFQGAAMTVWLSNPYSNPGVATVTYTCNNGQANNLCPPSLVFVPNPANQPTITGTIPAAAVDIISPDLKQPSVWKTNLAYETSLPFGLVAGAEWINTRNNNALHYTHLNLGAPTATGPDGRQLFYDAGGRSEACWTGAAGIRTNCGNNRANRNPAFTDVVLASNTSQGGGNALTLSLQSPNKAGFGWSVAYTRTDATEVNPLTSTRAISNWNGRHTFNPNEDVAENSNYRTQDRISGNMSWSRAFIGNYKTTFGVMYEGRSGKPYSWTYNNDMNGDGISGNDLMYIPSAPGSGEVLFYGATDAARKANEDQFWNVVNNNSTLSKSRGGVVGRNDTTAPFINTFDVRISQELPGFMPKHKGMISLDILNFGNLLNKEYGRIDEIGFPSNRSFVNYAGMKDGKYVYNTVSVEELVTRQAKGESQWAAQITLKYDF